MKINKNVKNLKYMRNLQTQDLWVLPHASQRQYIVQLTFS